MIPQTKNSFKVIDLQENTKINKMEEMKMKILHYIFKKFDKIMMTKEKNGILILKVQSL